MSGNIQTFISAFKHFISLTYLKGRATQWQRERTETESPIGSFPKCLQRLCLPGHSQELGVLSGSPTWLAGTQGFEQLSAASQHVQQQEAGLEVAKLAIESDTLICCTQCPSHQRFNYYKTINYPHVFFNRKMARLWKLHILVYYTATHIHASQTNRAKELVTKLPIWYNPVSYPYGTILLKLKMAWSCAVFLLNNAVCESVCPCRHPCKESRSVCVSQCRLTSVDLPVLPGEDTAGLCSLVMGVLRCLQAYIL